MKKYLLVTLLLLSACSASSRFFQLQPASDNVAISSRRMSIGIEEVNVPQYLDRPQIVLSRGEKSEMRFSEFNRWVEPLSTGISRVLAEDISSYMPKSEVKPKNYASEKFDYTVDVEVNKFDAVMRQKVSLDAWWTISKKGKIVARGRTKLENEIKKWGYDGIIEEQNRMVNQMAKQIAEKLVKL